jgi:hypothetical protein
MNDPRYRDFLLPLEDDLIQRDVCDNSDAFVEQLAQALLSLLRRRPKKVTRTSPALQGNICEFCVWELGSQHWKLYRKSFSWPANAKSPLRANSNPGVDIVAIDDNADKVYVIEVKSTKSGGGQYIDGDSSSLKQDFSHLFEKPKTAPEDRIWGSINAVVADLSIQGCPELADKVNAAVGDDVESSTGVQLVGVIVCKKGQDTRSHGTRKQHFLELKSWLLSEGWKANQCKFRTVELEDFEVWYKSFLRKVTE